MSTETAETARGAVQEGRIPGAARIADAFVVRGEPGSSSIECAQCGHSYGSARRDPKLGTVMSEGPIDELSPLNAWGLTDRLVVRSFFCPGCAMLVAVDVQERGDPILLETRLAGPGG